MPWGRRNLRDILNVSIGGIFWGATVRLTVRCGASSAGASGQISTVGGLGLIENNTGLTRGFGDYTLIERSVTVSTQSSGRLCQTVMVDLRIQCEHTFVKIKGAKKHT